MFHRLCSGNGLHHAGAMSPPQDNAGCGRELALQCEITFRRTSKINSIAREAFSGDPRHQFEQSTRVFGGQGNCEAALPGLHGRLSFERAMLLLYSRQLIRERLHGHPGVTEGPPPQFVKEERRGERRDNFRTPLRWLAPKALNSNAQCCDAESCSKMVQSIHRCSIAFLMHLNRRTSKRRVF